LLTIFGAIPCGSITQTAQQVDQAVLNRLHGLLSDPDFARLEPTYLPSPGGADLQDYTVTAEVGGRTLKTMSRDAANPPPDVAATPGAPTPHCWSASLRRWRCGVFQFLLCHASEW